MYLSDIMLQLLLVNRFYLVEKHSQTGLMQGQLKWSLGTSQVAQWIRICLPIQWTQVQSQIWEDPTCHGAIKPMSCNY